MKPVRDTPFEVGWSVWQPRPPRTSLTVVVKSSFVIVHGDVCTIAPEQVPVAGDVHHDDEPTRSVRYESDLAAMKPRGEVLLAGTCHVPSKVPLRVSAVAFEVGPVRKAIAVYGDRHWVPGVVATKSQAEPFNEMPLCWERALGGPTYEKNPVGKGLADVAGPSGGTYRPLPNLESPDAPIVAPDQRPDPAGAFPIPRTWRARTRFAGTMDAAYTAERWPWFPADFNPAYFNAAPLDQQIDGMWRGDEPIKLTHLFPGRPQVETRLPGLRARAFVDRVAPGRFEEVSLGLDTIVIDADANRVHCLWRGLADVGSLELDDIAHLYVVHEPLGARTDARHWRARFLVAIGRAAAEEKAGAPEPPPAPPAAMPQAPSVARSPGSAPPKPASVRPPSTPPLPGAPAVPALSVPAAPAVPALSVPAAPAAPASQEAAAGAPAPVESPPSGAVAPAPIPGEGSAAPAVPPPLAPGTAARLRDEVVARLERNEPLCGLDLTGADLSGLVLRKVDLSRAILAWSDLRGVRLDGANLDGANLARSDLRGAALAGATLRAADLTGARAESVAFDDAVLDDADLSGAELHLASFFGASCVGTLFLRAQLVGATFDEAKLDKAELDGARLVEASFQRASLVDATLQGCALHRARFDDADLTKVRASDGAVFLDASLVRIKGTGARFARSDLTRADLSFSVLDHSDFDRATLRSARLDGSSLKGARFAHAKAIEVSLVKANVHQGSFEAADLTRADLRGANLFGAQLWRARMEGARFELTNVVRTLLQGIVR